MAIVTTAEYKVYAGITETTYDTLIGVLVEAAQAQIERYIGYPVDFAARTAEVDGTGTDVLFVDSTPLFLVTSVALRGYEDDFTTIDSESYRSEDGGTLYRIGGAGFVENALGEWVESYRSRAVWPEGRKNVRVAYTSGYATADMPADLKLAAYRVIDSLFENRRQDQISTQTAATGAASRTMALAMERVQNEQHLLGRFRSGRFGV